MYGYQRALYTWLACWTSIRAHASAGACLGASMRSYRCKRLVMALAQRVVSAGLIHHSDRGRQYCSNVYVERLLDVGAYISMSTPGQPTENAFVESFIKTLKCEEVYVHQYRTFEEAAAALADVSGGCVECQTTPLIVGLCAS
jgi:transposase InsO family protein